MANIVYFDLETQKVESALSLFAERVEELEKVLG